jgi:excisionase family DNA binding protein
MQIEDNKWYSVKELSHLTGWSVDTIRRLIYRGHLKAVMLPVEGRRRKRIFRSCRILGLWWRQFIERNSTSLAA